MDYHKVIEDDCLSVATEDERDRLAHITDFELYKALAKRWCDRHSYKLGGYLGSLCWDATRQ